MGRICKADKPGDLGDGQIGACQELPGLFHAPGVHVLHDTYTHLGFEEALKVGDRQMSSRGEARQTQMLVQVAVDIVQYATNHWRHVSGRFIQRRCKGGQARAKVCTD